MRSNVKEQSGEETTIEALFPNWTEAEREEAKSKLLEYVRLAHQIYSRLTHDPSAYAEYERLTELANSSSLAVVERDPRFNNSTTID